MAALDPLFRVCPTRIDGTGVLFAHRIASKKCRDRQRKLYHKCFTCAWNDNHVSAHGAPPVQLAVQPAEEREIAAPAEEHSSAVES